MKIIKKSADGQHWRVLKSLENSEKQRRLLTLEKEQRVAAHSAKLMRAAEQSKGFMRPVFSMSAQDYFHSIQKYGQDEVMSDEFAKFHTKKHPEQRGRIFH